MWIRAILLSAALVSATAFMALRAASLTTASGVQNPPAPLGVIQGVVLRYTDAQPIEGARVTLLPGTVNPVRGRGQRAGARGGDGPLNTVTGVDGRFSFQGLAAGVYTVSFESDGYFGPPDGSGEYPPLSFINVEVRGQGTEITAPLIPGATLTGTIRDSAGRPVRNAVAALFRVVYVNGSPGLEGVTSRETDDRGQFRLFRVPPGEYYLAATSGGDPTLLNTRGARGVARGGPGARGPQRGTALPLAELPFKTYYPGVIDPRNSSPFILRAGEEIQGVQIILQTAAPVKVTGRLVGGAGSPEIRLVPSDRSISEGALAGTQTRVTGATAYETAFEVTNVLPGAYELIATIPNGTMPTLDPEGRGNRGNRGNQGVRGRGQRGAAIAIGPSALAGRAAVNIGSVNVEDVTVFLQPAAEIRGILTLDGQPAEGNAQVSLVGDGNVGNAAQVPGESGANGETLIAFNALPAVRYRFLITFGPGGRGRGAGPGLYVADVVQGGRSVFDSGIVAGETADRFEVILKRGSATISGTVYRPGQRPAIGATVALVPPPGRRDNLNLYSSAVSDGNGHFEIRAAPGDYKLFAWDYLPSGAFQNPAVIARVEDRGVAVRLDPNAGHVVDVVLIER